MTPDIVETLQIMISLLSLIFGLCIFFYKKETFMAQKNIEKKINKQIDKESEKAFKVIIKEIRGDVKKSIKNCETVMKFTVSTRYSTRETNSAYFYSLKRNKIYVKANNIEIIEEELIKKLKNYLKICGYGYLINTTEHDKELLTEASTIKVLSGKDYDFTIQLKNNKNH